MSYDSWKLDHPEDDCAELTPCPICTGHNDAPPCSESCEDIALTAARRRWVADCYRAARVALRWARIYEAEGIGEHRVSDCVKQIRVYRNNIRIIRRIRSMREVDKVLARTLRHDLRDAVAS